MPRDSSQGKEFRTGRKAIVVGLRASILLALTAYNQEGPGRRVAHFFGLGCTCRKAPGMRRSERNSNAESPEALVPRVRNSANFVARRFAAHARHQHRHDGASPQTPALASRAL